MKVAPKESSGLSLVAAYAVTAVVFLALDATWLSLTAERLYRPALGHLMQAGFDLFPALAFYLVYFAGIVVFAVAPAAGRWRAAFGHGALLGLVAYSTYDLTNQATLRGWPWHVTAADLCWGTAVTALSAAAATFATARLGARRG
ncbi:MAG: DUF2177 family protein [Caldimonas sp.]